MNKLILAAVFLVPALADAGATMAADTPSAAAYRAHISWMEAQQLATQQTDLQAACTAARNAGTALPAGC